MSGRRLFLVVLLFSLILSISARMTSVQQPTPGIIAGQNVNVVGGIDVYTNHPNQQRQNEPTLAFSTRNMMNILACFNDYRTIDIPFQDALPGVNPTSAVDAWLGYSQSNDGGLSWSSRLLPGFPQDDSPEGLASPLKEFGTAADPVVRAATNGLFPMAGIAFNRNLRNGNVVFVSRFIDNNNREFESAIKHVDTQICNRADADVFFDKPWLEVDGPHGVGQRVTIDGQSIPKSNFYLAYAGFMGAQVATKGYTGMQGDDTLSSQIYFQRSTDCGETWEAPIIFDSPHNINQGVAIAVDPRNNGQLICVWRTFGEPYDAIMAAISTNGGVGWDRIVEVATFPHGPFDQPTHETMFRTNTYPTATIDHLGYIYVVFTQRGMGPNGEARLMIVTSPDGLSWSAPMRVDSPADQLRPGYQFMPTITFAAGKLMLARYDQCYDVVQYDYPVVFNDFYIAENYLPLYHTIDVRVTQAEPSLAPVFSDSIQASRYLWAVIGDQAIQLENNRPGLKLFEKGKSPFIGDLIDIVPSARFLPKNNGWEFNKDPNPTTTYMLGWTDNRDVLGEDLRKYTSPGSSNCEPEYTGVRNQNVYTARISQGIIAGSPGNTKPLNIKRAFVLQAKNTTANERTIRFEIDPSTAPVAKFWEAGVEYDYLVRTIPPYSAFATTVLVEPYSNEYEPVYINILENGNIISQVMLNPDPTNPEIIDPYNNNPAENPHIVNDEVHTPHIVNWTYEEVNPHIVNYDPDNPHIVNTDMVTPHIVNYDLENPHIVNETINPHIVNPHIVNVAPESSGTDTIYTVENAGNTTSSYSLGTYPADVPEGILVQILVYKIYTTPTAKGCELNQSEHHELLVNHTNPHIVNVSPNSTIQGSNSISQENEDVWDIHFYLEPGEKAYVVYRTYNPNPDSINFDEPLVPKLTSDIADVTDGNFDPMSGFAIIITTLNLFDGISGDPYSASLQAFGGTGNYTWSLADGSAPLPSGLSLSDTGIISGTPDVPGAYGFTVKVTDDGAVPQTSTQALSLNIVEELVILEEDLLDGVVGQPYPGPQMRASGGTGSYTWSLDGEPTWMSIDPSSGMISGTPDAAGPITITVSVTDQGNPFQTAAVVMSASIADPLEITTESLPNAVNGWSYSAPVEAQGGVGDYTWSLAEGSDPLPSGLSLSENGLISGDPDAPGSYSFTVQVQDQFTPDPLTAAKMYTITVYDTLTIKTISEDLDPAYVGTEYTATLAVEGGCGPFTWSLAEGSDPLPTGLSIGESGIISGEPVYDPEATYPQSYDFKVHVQDSFSPWQEDTQDLTLTIHPKEAYWAVMYEGIGETEASAIAVDPEGSIYVVGKIIASGIGSDLYIAKYDSSGLFQWEKIHDGGQGDDEAKAVAVDSTGVYVAGYVTGANSDADIFMIKYTSSGDLQPPWPITYDGGYGDDKASAIVAKNGLVCLTGFSTGKTSGEDYFTMMYTSSGDWKWNVLYDGPAHQGDFASSVAISNAGHTCVTGSSFRGNKKTGHLDFHTITYDGMGNEIWEARYDGKQNGNDETLAICIDPEENVYVTGRSEQSKGSYKDYDWYTIAYDSLGNTKWEVRHNSGNGHDEAHSIAVDASGVYVTGFDMGAATGPDYRTVKYSIADGQILGEARYDAANGEDKATGLALDAGGVYVTGWSQGTGASFDIFTIKYSTSLSQILWDSRYDGGNSEDYAVAIVSDLAGNVYVTGFSLVGAAKNMITLKY